MKRRVPVPGGTLEYAVLRALWDLGEASVRQVHERVGERQDLGYTTIATVLDRLRAKGLALKRRAEDNTLRYRAAFSRESVERTRAHAVLAELFGSPSRPAMAGLVDALESVDPELIEELARAVAARRRIRNRH
jgi:predicted transcriptional regulator